MALWQVIPRLAPGAAPLHRVFLTCWFASRADTATAVAWWLPFFNAIQAPQTSPRWQVGQDNVAQPTWFGDVSTPANFPSALLDSLSAFANDSTYPTYLFDIIRL